MAELVLVSVSTGVVDAVRSKLNSMIERPNLRKLEEEIRSLEMEMRSMSAILNSSAMMHAPDLQVTELMKQVREASYDAEDCVDRFLHHQARFKSIFVLLGVRRNHRFAMQIRQIKARLAEVNERKIRYLVSVDPVFTADARNSAAHLGPFDASATIDPQLISMRNTTPVAIDGPRDQLLHSLSLVEENHTKVAFIVGMAGIGKTTLAVQVYGTLQKEFSCRAFVYVGKTAPVTTVLAEIISQVGGQQKHDGVADDEYQAINQLRGLLQDKRYLIIIDDIWSISAWKAISCALPKNNLGSRIIGTTRIFDVARSCCSHPSDLIYQMMPLKYSDSLSLFHIRVFGSEKEDCPERCRNLHDRILKICAGLPSTILVVAGLLARTENLETWEMTLSTLSTMEQRHQMQRMSEILHFSYTRLPLSAKSCLLYMSIFPKNYVVNRDRLIWRWIAEGFIPSRVGASSWETGRGYFNELINRSLIQPVFEDDGDDDDPLACTVHGAIHDFIVSVSSAENFVTLDEQLQSRPRDVVRRLTLNYSMQEESGGKLELDLGSIKLSRARSLTVLGRAQQMPNLTSFQLLRVLDLEDADKLENSNLEVIGKLFLLKYLGLGGQSVTKLPKTIGKLRLLETLEMRRTEVRKLPAAVSQQPNLVRILAKALDDIPGGVGKMQDLQEVSMVSVNSNHALDFVGNLVKLRHLRVLGMKWCCRDEQKFISCLREASKSKSMLSLSIHCDEACPLEFLVDNTWELPYLLQKLVMERSNCFFRRIPNNLVKCQGLAYLEIGIDLDGEIDLVKIAFLPSLSILKLSAKGKPPIVISDGFHSLKVFSFQRWEWEGDLAAVVFKIGAMPLLRKLCLHFKVISQLQQHNRFVSGVKHLGGLNQLNVKIDCEGATLTTVESAEEAIRNDVCVQGKDIKIEITRDNEEMMKRLPGVPAGSAEES